MAKGIKVWNSGELLFWFHRPKEGRKMWSLKKTVIFEFIFVAMAIFIFLRK